MCGCNSVDKQSHLYSVSCTNATDKTSWREETKCPFCCWATETHPWPPGGSRTTLWEPHASAAFHTMFPMSALSYISNGHTDNVAQRDRNMPKVIKSSDRSETSNHSSWLRSCTGGTGFAAELSKPGLRDAFASGKKILKINTLTNTDNTGSDVSWRWTVTLSFYLLTVHSFVRKAALQEWAAS